MPVAPAAYPNGPCFGGQIAVNECFSPNFPVKVSDIEIYRDTAAYTYAPRPRNGVGNRSRTY